MNKKLIKALRDRRKVLEQMIVENQHDGETLELFRQEVEILNHRLDFLTRKAKNNFDD